MPRYVAYLRRSTTDQEQSLDRQREEITRYATDNGVQITFWYEDDSISGLENESRPGFQQMIADAKNRQFDVIIVHEISRFGRFDSHRSGKWLDLLRECRVRIEAVAGRVRDPYSMIGKVVLALEQDREESFKLSFRTLTGQRMNAVNGLRAGGRCPYAYARLRTRLDGKTEVIGRMDGIAKRNKTEVVKLIPGDPTEVSTVRLIFKMAAEGAGYGAIARHLNASGIPSADAHRRRAGVRVPGRWVSGSVRAILISPVYIGTALWNSRSCPKFHRLENGRVVEVSDEERDQPRWNSKEDVIAVERAHDAIIDPETFFAANQRLQSLPSRTRGHVHEYLLTGLVTCVNCGDVVVGTVRSRELVIDGKKISVPDPRYVCNGTLRSGGGCRQVPIPRDVFERAVLQILEEELLSEPALARLELRMRRIAAARRSRPTDDGIPALEKREKELAARVADGARRLLLIEQSLMPEVKAALTKIKDDLEGVRTTLAAKRRARRLAANGEDSVAKTIADFRSMAAVLRDATVPLERRREVLRCLLPKRGKERPIRVVIDPKAKKGWKNALKRILVRHLAIGEADEGRPTAARSASQVSPAVAAEAGHPEAPGWDLADRLPTCERELVADAVEAESALVGAGTNSWE